MPTDRGTSTAEIRFTLEAQTPHNIRHTEKQEAGKPNHQKPAIN